MRSFSLSKKRSATFWRNKKKSSLPTWQLSRKTPNYSLKKVNSFPKFRGSVSWTTMSTLMLRNWRTS
jgi:hypothetical protein